MSAGLNRDGKGPVMPSPGASGSSPGHYPEVDNYVHRYECASSTR